jgi:hypothetical protein
MKFSNKSCPSWRTISLLLSVILSIVIILNFNYLQLNYYFWRLGTTSEGCVILELIEGIRNSASGETDLLTKIFLTTPSPMKRHAAMLALADNNKKSFKIQELFLKSLHSSNTDIVSSSILGLYYQNNTTAYTTIVQLSTSKNSEIRTSVAKYMRILSNDYETILIELAYDKNYDVRCTAVETLSVLWRLNLAETVDKFRNLPRGAPKLVPDFPKQ